MNKEVREIGGRASKAIINFVLVAGSKLCVSGGPLAQGPCWKRLINEGLDEPHCCWKGLLRATVIWHPSGPGMMESTHRLRQSC